MLDEKTKIKLKRLEEIDREAKIIKLELDDELADYRKEQYEVLTLLAKEYADKEFDELQHLIGKDGIDVYSSDDYAGLDIGLQDKNISFYFGYESTLPIKDDSLRDEEDCEDVLDDEWCFVVKENDKEVLKIPQSKLHLKKRQEPLFYLLKGIGLYFKKCQLLENKL